VARERPKLAVAVGAEEARRVAEQAAAELEGMLATLPPLSIRTPSQELVLGPKKYYFTIVNNENCTGLAHIMRQL
jgi:hypothetical protein